MTTIPTTQVVLHLPQDVIEYLTRTAKQRHKTLDEIATEALRISLQPIRQEAIQRLEEQQKHQRALSDTQQYAMLDAHLTSEEQERLAHLLDTNRERHLNDEEQAQLTMLYDRIEAVATQKAAAILLLSERCTSTDINE